MGSLDQSRIGKLRNWLSPEEGEFTPADEEMLAFVKQSAPAIKLIREAADRPACSFGIPHNPSPDDYHGLACPRALSWLLCLSSRVAAIEGRKADAMADVQAAWKLAEHLATEPIVFVSMIACAFESQAFETLQYLLDNGVGGSEILKTCHGPRPASYQAAVSRAIRVGTFSEFYCKMVEPSTLFKPEDMHGGSGYLVQALAKVNRLFLWQTQCQAHLRWMRVYEQLASRPYYDAVHEWRNPPQPPAGFWGGFIHKELSTVSQAAALADARRRLAMLAFACMRYRSAAGSFPSELDELVPRHILSIPVDPFSGRRMQMLKTDDGIVIYSVGPNLTDDGGSSYDWRKKTGDVSLRLPASSPSSTSSPAGLPVAGD